MSRIWLAPSDSSLANAVQLTNEAGVGSGAGTMTVRAGLHLPPPTMKADGGSSSSSVSDDGSGWDVRTVTCDLYISGATAVELHQFRRDIQNLLDMARRSTGTPGGHWVGNPVSLWVSELESPSYIRFDVLHGALNESIRDYGPAHMQQWQLVLTCLPFGRGEPILDPQSATLTNGLAGYLVRNGVPGDARALCQLTLTDESDTNGSRVPVLQGGRIAVRSLRWGTPFTPVVLLSNLGRGISFSDSTSTGPLNGASTPRLATADNTWSKVGVATVNDGTHGLLDLYPHFRDGSSPIGPPQNLQATVIYGTGSLVAKTTYTLLVTELDGSGNETTGCIPVSVTLENATGEVVLTWTVTGSPTNHRVYFSLGGGPYSYWSTGSALGTYTFDHVTSPTGTANPPSTSDPAILPCQVRVSVGMNVTNPVWSAPGPPITPVLRGGQWEYGYGGTFPCPQMPRQEGAADLGFKVLVEARVVGTATPTLDVDGLWMLPHDEPQMVAEFAGLGNTAASRYVLDTRRDGRASGLVTDQSTPPVNTGHLAPRGQFTLGPGDNTIIFMLEDTNGCADVTHLKFRAQLRIVPRYVDVIGLVA